MILRNEKGQFVKGSKSTSSFKAGVYQGYGFKKGSVPWNKDCGVKKTCLVCKKEFKVNSGNDNKYCSMKCYNPTRRKTKVMINCKQCGKLFYSRPDKIAKGQGMFCSKVCISESLLKDDASYSALHKWVISHLGTPCTCEHCGKDGLTRHSIHWASISHEYKRDLSDWIRLCVPCHSKFDRERKLLLLN